MKRTFLVVLILGALSATAFAAAGDVTVRGASGEAKGVAAGETIMTGDGAVSRYEIEGRGRAVTVPCPVCGMNSSGVAPASQGTSGLVLTHGGLALDLGKVEGSTFELRGPVGVAVVRGTRFAGLAHHDGGETYVVAEGELEVTVQGAPAGRILAGQAQDLTADGSAQPVRQAHADEIALAQSATQG